MACQEQDTRTNRYRLKCPGPLSVPSSQRYQPYHRPMSSFRFCPDNAAPSPVDALVPPVGGYYVPTPPCPAPGTWANTFSYDDYSTKVWAPSFDQHHRVYLQFQSAIIQRDILMSESRVYSQQTSGVYTSTPRPKDVPDNIALSIMKEESDAGYLSMSIISRVSPDGDICDDVLDPGNCPSETSNDIPERRVDTVCDTSVPSANSPVIYTVPDSTIPEVAAHSTFAQDSKKKDTVVRNEPELKQVKAKKGHKEPGRYDCTVCGKVFGWRTGLVTHLRVHTGERPYMCPDCPKSFSDYSTYAKHCRIHSGVKPYSCDICGKAFTQSGNRLRHMRTVHKAK